MPADPAALLALSRRIQAVSADQLTPALNEEVAAAVGYRAQYLYFDSDEPVAFGWTKPDGAHSPTLPDFLHSLDAAMGLRLPEYAISLLDAPSAEKQFLAEVIQPRQQRFASRQWRWPCSAATLPAALTAAALEAMATQGDRSDA